MFSIGNMVWDSQRTSVSAAVGRTFSQSQGISRQVRTRECGFWHNLKASALQRHFWVRNVPYNLAVLSNSLKSQQMRAPSERTTDIVQWWRGRRESAQAVMRAMPRRAQRAVAA